MEHIKILENYLYDEIKSTLELFDEDINFEDNYTIWRGNHIYYHFLMIKYGDEYKVKSWYFKLLNEECNPTPIEVLPNTDHLITPHPNFLKQTSIK